MRRTSRMVICLLGLLWGMGGATGAPTDLTFLHTSDPHVPHAFEQTRATLAALPTGEVNLEPYGVTVAPPSFVIITGDLNEFGGGRGWWEQYLGLWRDFPLPIYHQLGNHDNTWRCGRPRLRELHGGVFYAFEKAGVKFIGWDTATPQDPRPSIAEEGVRWLTAEFARTPLEQPVIFFCHHPPDSREFAGPYDRARLLDLLRTRNVVLVLVGHGHKARTWQVEGFDVVMGGSTFGDRPGFGIVSIRDGVLRVCHQYVREEARMIALLEKPLPDRSPFPAMQVTPGAGTIFAGDEPLSWRVEVDPADRIMEGRWVLDGDRSGALQNTGGTWTVSLDGDALEPGAHVLRFELDNEEGRTTSRTVDFYRNGGAFEVVWRQELAGSSQSTPAVADGRVYVGDNSGALTALDVATGEILWRFETGGEVRSRPVISADGRTIYFGSADGALYALTPEGKLRWRFDADSALYGSPVLFDGRVVFGTAAGEVISLDGDTGKVIWRSEAPEYAIERAPCVGADGVYVGAWDRNAYALELSDGTVRWRAPSAGSNRDGFVAWYYSPADCPPACAGDRVFFADRAYRLTIFEARTGARVLDEEKCVAVASSDDGRFVYVRHTDGRVSKRDTDGAVIWTTEVPTGAVATPPVPAGELVWVISDRGMLSALDAETGAVLAQQRIMRDLFAFAAPAYDGERVYVADMAGRITALTPTFLSAR